MTNPICPKCSCDYPYEDRNLWVCPDCSFEWDALASQETSAQIASEIVVKDAHGNVLKDGDTVTVIKDLKVKGSSSSVKVGTKVKNIRIIDGADDHNISCKIDGFGAMNLKSEFVKRS